MKLFRSLPREDSETSVQGLIETATHPNKTAKIFAIMGPNGSGKTRFINQLYIKYINEMSYSFYLIPKYEIFDLRYDHGDLDNNGEIDDFDDYVQKMLFMRNIQQGGIFATILRAIVRKDASDIEKRQTIINQLVSEEKFDEARDLPKNKSRVSKITSVIEDVIGYKCVIKISNTVENGIELKLMRDNISFGINDLSSGEQQLLSLCLLTAVTKPLHAHFFVDEPELHLNERRAIEIWSRVESNFPNSVFVYATHSANFATRPEVSKICLFDGTQNAQIIDNGEDLPQSALADLVGARVQVLRSNKRIIFCEDTLSKLVLNALFRDDNISAVALSGWHSIDRTVMGDKGWGQIRAGRPKFCGVIDRDARDEKFINKLELKKIICIPYYDIESWVLNEHIFIELLNPSIPLEVYKSALILAARARFQAQLKKFAHFAYENYRSSPSLERLDSLEIGAPDFSFPTEELHSAYNQRANGLKSAIENRSISQILRQMSGKTIYSELRSRSKDLLGIVDLPAAELLFSSGCLRKDVPQILNSDTQAKQFKDTVFNALG